MDQLLTIIRHGMIAASLQVTPCRITILSILLSIVAKLTFISFQLR